jgi:hypothetical protein
MKKKDEQRVKKHHISIKLLLTLLSILIVLLAYIALIQEGILINPIKQFKHRIQILEVEDSCAIIAGKKINPLANEGICHNACIAECDSLKGTLQESTFIYGDNACNKCTCTCKI